MVVPGGVFCCYVTGRRAEGPKPVYLSHMSEAFEAKFKPSNSHTVAFLFSVTQWISARRISIYRYYSLIFWIG